MGKIRRKFSAEFKAEIAQLIVSGQQTQSAIAREKQIAPVLLKKWVETYSSGVGFLDKPSARETRLEKDVEKLQSKIGQLVMEIDLLKKVQAFSQRQKKLATCVVTSKNLDQLRKDAK